MDLSRACKYGDLDQCKRIAEAIADTYSPEDGALSPLHWLMLGNNVSDADCVEILSLLQFIDVNHKANDVVLPGSSQLAKTSGVTVLHLAVLYKGMLVIRKLLELGANPDHCDSEGNTALHHAAELGSADEVSLLLEFGADPTVCTSSNVSPFAVSASPETKQLIVSSLTEKLLKCLRNKSNLDSVSTYLRCGADVNGQDPTGVPVLHLAVRTGNSSTVLEVLERSELDVNSVDVSSGTNVVHEIVLASLPECEKEEILHELLFLKVDVNLLNKEAKSPVDLCLSTGNRDLAKVLLDNGAIGSLSRSQSGTGTPVGKARRGGMDDSPSAEGIVGRSGEPLSPQIQYTQSSAARDDGLMIDLSEVAIRAGLLFAELQCAKSSVDSMVPTSPGAGRGRDPAPVVITKSHLVAQKEEQHKKLDMYLAEFNRLRNDPEKDMQKISTFMELQRLIATCRTDLAAVTNKLTAGDFEVDPPSPVAKKSAKKTQPSGWFRSPDSIEADIEACVRTIRKSTGSSTGVDEAIFELISRCQSNDVIPVLKLLRNRGANVNYREKLTGFTALLHACASANTDNVDLVDWLLGNSADPSVVEKKRGWTCLHFAAAKGSKAVCKSILKRSNPALLGAKDVGGKIASELCNNSAVKKVLEAATSG